MFSVLEFSFGSFFMVSIPVFSFIEDIFMSLYTVVVVLKLLFGNLHWFSFFLEKELFPFLLCVERKRLSDRKIGLGAGNDLPGG